MRFVLKYVLNYYQEIFANLINFKIALKSISNSKRLLRKQKFVRDEYIVYRKVFARCIIKSDNLKYFYFIQMQY